ncbi:MAG: hypothetical protein A2902_05185 [Elusimicrobia bacterium RIFCSPLOWO2_01_FULL_64_13]|nr:MAG: hypothetical protein A2902_05185 [Elusimicrobia bacterium RIFCSPLOWO2_01_FULL_64_13]
MAGEEGEHVDLPRLQVDRAPPLLEIFSPVEKLKTSKDSVSVNGRTETGCFVTVNGYQVSIGEDGKFYWSVVIPGKGVHEIVIVSTDMKGNASREVRTVIKR